jgi:hypothetical protein
MKFEPIKLIWQRKYKAGYILKREIWRHDGKNLEITSAYNHKGDYIGNPRDAYFLCAKHGIKPELAPGHTICTIGFSEKHKQWFGWSHRAITGFGIGDRVFEEKFGTDKTPFNQHGKIRIWVMSQAKIAAIRFAEYIG